MGTPARASSSDSSPSSPNLTLVGLVPEQAFELELLDEEGRSLAVQTARLAAGERAELTLGSAPDDGR